MERVSGNPGHLRGRKAPLRVMHVITRMVRGGAQHVLLALLRGLKNEEMELVLHKRMRPEKKFSSRDELIKAIAADVQYVREYFKA